MHSSIKNAIGKILLPLQGEFYIVEVDGKNVAVIELPFGKTNLLFYRV